MASSFFDFPDFVGSSSYKNYERKYQIRCDCRTYRCNVGHDTTLRDDDVAKEFLQPDQSWINIKGLRRQKADDSLLIVSDGKLQVTRDNTLLLVITCRIPSKLQNFGGKVLENGSEVDYDMISKQAK